MKDFKKRLKRVGKEDWSVAGLWLLSTRSVRPAAVVCGLAIAGYFLWKLTRPLERRER